MKANRHQLDLLRARFIAGNAPNAPVINYKTKHQLFLKLVPDTATVLAAEETVGSWWRPKQEPKVRMNSSPVDQRHDSK